MMEWSLPSSEKRFQKNLQRVGSQSCLIMKLLTNCHWQWAAVLKVLQCQGSVHWEHCSPATSLVSRQRQWDSQEVEILDPQTLPETMPPDYGMAEITVLPEHFDGNGLVSDESDFQDEDDGLEGSSFMGGQWSARTCWSPSGRWF